MKLLTYSSSKYLWLSALLILLSIPSFYLVVDQLFLKSVDKSLKEDAALLPNLTKNIKNLTDLELWKNVDLDLEITLFNPSNFQEKPFTKEIYNPITEKDEQYRIIQKKVNIFGQDYSIALKKSLLEKKALLRSILIIQITLLLLLFIGFFIINRLISKKLWLPFNRILLFLTNYDLDKNIQPSEEPLEIDEFSELNDKINNLLIRSEKMYRIQKEFTENAAHELQTPIAIIKSKLDLLIQEKDLNKNQSQIIEQINYVIQKLSDLNKNLLLLTKIENQQFVFKDNIDLIAIVNNAVQNLNFFAEARYQQILFPKPYAVVLKGNDTLITQLIQNLLINAVQYSPKGSIINIILTENTLSFINEGKSLPFDVENLFVRFSKTIEKESKGNGLGLAISKKIADVHQFILKYNYQNSKHHFVIEFPKIESIS